MSLPKRPALEVLFLAALMAVGCSSRPQNRASAPLRPELADVYKALDEFPEFYLYRLTPNKVDVGEHLGGWEVVDRAKVDGEARQQLVAAFKEATAYEHPQADCFDPHHGIRVIDGDRTIDLAICFRCSSFEITSDGKFAGTFSIGGEDAPAVFDRQIKEQIFRQRARP